jgi:hypothetical protein
MAAFVPQCAILAKRLLGDPRVPRRAKAPLLLTPLPREPDRPRARLRAVLGQLDDGLLVVLVRRYVVRSTGREVSEELWPGDEGGRRVVLNSVPAAPAPAGTLP